MCVWGVCKRPLRKRQNSKACGCGQEGHQLCAALHGPAMAQAAARGRPVLKRVTVYRKPNSPEKTRTSPQKAFYRGLSIKRTAVRMNDAGETPQGSRESRVGVSEATAPKGSATRLPAPRLFKPPSAQARTLAPGRPAGWGKRSRGCPPPRARRVPRGA